MSVPDPNSPLGILKSVLGGHGFRIIGWADVLGESRGFKNADGKPRISVTQYYDDIGVGAIENHQAVYPFGVNLGVTDTAFEVISPLQFTRPSVAVPMEVISASAADSTAGTGIRTIGIHGLDADYNEFKETLNLNGVTPVPMVTPAVRIQSVHTESAGSGYAAAGNITFRSIGGGSNYAQILAGTNDAQCACITVPAGKKAVLKGWGWSSDGNANVQFRLQASIDPLEGNLTENIFHTLDQVFETFSDRATFAIPFAIQAKADIRVIAKRNSVGADSEANASLELFFEPA